MVSAWSVPLLAAWSAVLAGFVATVALRSRARSQPAAPLAAARVLLVRPCTLADPATIAAMATVPRAPTGAQLQWVGVVAHAEDPAWPHVRAIAASLAAHGMAAQALLSHARGPNRKAEQIDAAVARFGADADVIVVVDADVDLGSLDLAALLAPLGAPCTDVGVTWAAPIEAEATTLGDRLSRAILGGSLHAFSLLAALDPGLLVGKAFALRRETLESIGGAASLREYLGEDFELARRVRARGLQLRRCTTVRSLARGRRLGAVLERYTRWIAVVRAQRPARMISYPLLLAAAPLLLLGAVLTAPPFAAVAFATVALTLRAAAARLAAQRSGAAPPGLALALLADSLLLAAWLRAAAIRELRWAEQRLRLGRDGRLQP